MSSTAVQKATIVLYRVIILLHSAIIHYSFKIHDFLYMYFVAALSLVAISSYFSKSASPLHGNILYT